MLIALLAVFSASAAAGMRIALPLTVIGVLHSQQWIAVPLLGHFHPQVLLCILTSWSLFELFASKKLLGQRVLQTIQLVLSPLVGSLMGIMIGQAMSVGSIVWLTGIIGGVFALVLKLVEVGWFFRLRGIPLWGVFVEDALCIFLVFLAFKAPEQGGIIAMLLLWLAIRSSQEWRRCYSERLDKRTRV